MKAGFWQRHGTVFLYLSIALLWAVGVGASKAILIQTIKDSSAREQRLAAVTRYHESVQNNDLRQAFEVVTEDVKVQAPATLTQSGLRVGREELRHLLQEIKMQFGRKLEVNRYLDVGANQVLALVTWHEAEAGKKLGLPLLELFDFQDGHIRAVRMFAGDEALIEQLMLSR